MKTTHKNIVKPHWLKIALITGLAAVSFQAALAQQPAPTLPSIPSGTFNITSYGASTSSANNATAIQAAITAASAAGGGTVEIPAGIFLSGPITLANKICLDVESGATLRMLAYGTWPGSTPLITASGLINVKINGTGTIDGQGSAWWTAYNANNSLARPGVIYVTSCTNIQVSEVTLLNAPNVHISFHYQNNEVTINNVTVSAPSTSPNTDGCDIEGVNILFANDNFSDGDDNIAIVGEHLDSQYMVVTNCTFGTGHGMTIGSYTSDGVDHLWVENCVFNGTSNGIRLKASEGRGGTVQYLTYSGLTMNNVAMPINIQSWYPSAPSDPVTAPSGTVDSTTPIWKHIGITGLTATGASNAGIIYGLPYEYVGAIGLTNINITATTGYDIYYASSVAFSGSSVHVSSGAACTIYDATVTGITTTEY